MYIEQLLVADFRHIKDAQFGQFRKPGDLSELIVLAGPNGGGKSSILELLSYGLAHRYSWKYYSSRKITEHSFAIKIGLTEAELDVVSKEAESAEIIKYARRERGYWMQVNMPNLISSEELQINEKVHGLVSKKFQKFARKLGFFIRSDRGYGARKYDRNNLFTWRRRLEAKYFNTISYAQTTEQYADMYDFLVEQSYHHIYDLGMYLKTSNEDNSTTRPDDPLRPYNELLKQLFPGYSFSEITREELSLRVKLPTGDVIPFQDISSGEKEVFFILSFFLRHNISESVIVIDEPELHLHPELARKLLKLMRIIRPGNQIWCATHSAELVDEAGRERTFFLRRSDDMSRCECVAATMEGAEIESLRDLFGYSGYVGISRKVVFLEGAESSADRKTFVNLFPDLSQDIKIIPVGSVDNLYRINKAILALLESDFARCEFYLIRDRDYLSDEAIVTHRQRAAGKLFILSRHHIENYLMDEYAIADVLKTVFQQELSPEQVKQKLFEIALNNSAAFLRDFTVFRFSELYQSENCSVENHSSGLSVLTKDGETNQKVVQPLQQALLERISQINKQVSGRTDVANAEHIFGDCLEEVCSALDYEQNGWKNLFPGRYILKRLSSKYQLGAWPALQNLLIDRLSKNDLSVDEELKSILDAILQ